MKARTIRTGSSTLRRVAGFFIVTSLMLTGVVTAQDRDRRSDDGRRDSPRDTAPWRQQDGSWLAGFGTSIGAAVRDTTAAEVAAAGLAQPGGAWVVSVAPGGPAAQAGVQGGDVIVEFDGERVRGAQHLGRLVRETSEGRTVKAMVVRDKARRTVDLTPANAADALYSPEVRRRVEEALEDAMAQLRRHFDSEGFRRHFPFGERRQLGVELLPLSDQLAEHFGVKEGVLVARVRAESPASQAGIKAGDIIVSVNATAVRTPEDVTEAMASGESTIRLSVVRDKKELSLTATLPAARSRSSGRSRSI